MMKVLYAEDERQLSVAVVEILKMEGFDVTPVYDGEEALEALDKDYFDAVVLDIMMPKKDGIEVLEAMRQNGNHTCVLMLTAKATLDDRIAGLSTGADDYLSKPFAMKELVARLQSLIRRNNDYRHSVIKYANIELQHLRVEIRQGQSAAEQSRGGAFDLPRPQCRQDLLRGGDQRGSLGRQRKPREGGAVPILSEKQAQTDPRRRRRRHRR